MSHHIYWPIDRSDENWKKMKIYGVCFSTGRVAKGNTKIHTLKINLRRSFSKISPAQQQRHNTVAKQTASQVQKGSKRKEKEKISKQAHSSKFPINLLSKINLFLCPNNVTFASRISSIPCI
jgi:hypothetical protein